MMNHTSSRSHLTLPIVATIAVAGLSLSACSGDESPDTDSQGEPSSAVTVGTSDATDDGSAEETTEDTTDESTEDATEEPTEDASPDDQETSNDASAPSAQEPIYVGFDAVQDEYPEGTIFEMQTDDGVYEWHVLDGGQEYEVRTDPTSGDVVGSEPDDAPDGDDLAEIEAIEVSLDEALRTASDEGGSAVEDAELDTEDGVVRWEIELENGQEIYVDVTTGDVVSR